MKLLNKIGLMTTTDGATLARNLIISSDMDYDLAVKNVLAKSQSFTAKAKTARANFDRLNREAEVARTNAANAAADEFKKATGSKVDTASLRKAANRLLLITNFFEKWDITGVLKGFVNEVLAFKGINEDVLSQMRQAAAKKIAEAQRAEKAAADALVAANTAFAAATTKIAEQFKADVARAQPELANAVQFEALAASLLESHALLKSVA